MKTIFRMLLVGAVSVAISNSSYGAFGGKKEELHENVEKAIKLLQKEDPSIVKFFEEAHGYAIFPSVGKGGFGVGAARGNGEVYEKGELVGTATLTQVTVGFQLGGQVYMEVVFFEDEEALESFKGSNFELSAQASAVAAAEGVAANAKYELGVAIFTMAKTGLMYEASVGGQKFKFKEAKKKGR